MDTEHCYLCGKLISDEEWVVHWRSCAECFDRGYEEYLRQQDAHIQSQLEY